MKIRRYRRDVGMLVYAAFALVLAGCVTNIAPSTQNNPPPTESLAHFSHFQLLPMEASPAAKEEAEALAKIDGNLQQHIKPLIASWEKQDAGGRNLQIQPYVQDLKFVGGGARFFAGALAGSSAVVMKVKLIDAETKAVIAEPEFYQRAAAMGGAWSVGATDNDMLNRIATVFREYLERNYDKPVGGPTGLEEANRQ